MARPIEQDPKIQIRAGVKTSVVKKLGGIEKVTKLVTKLLTDKAKEKSERKRESNNV